MNSAVLPILSGLLATSVAVLGYLVWHFQSQTKELRNTQEEYREQREAVVDMLNRIGLRIGSSLDLDEALGIIAEYMVETTHAESGAIFLLDVSGRHLRAKAVEGLFPPMHETTDYVLTKRKYLAENLKRDRIEIGEGIIGFVAQTGEALLIADALADPRVPKTSTDFLLIRSMIVAPLLLKQSILGVFAVVNRRNEEVFTDQDLRLLQQLAAQAALTVNVVRLYEHDREQRRIEQELHVAKEFQKMLLPAHLPQPGGFDVAAFSKPALEVGGDYFDFIWVEKPMYLGVAIVDVSGKGIPGALVMAILRSTLRAAAPGCASPKEVLERVNRSILADTQQSVFITMTYVILDVNSRKIRFARAGHEPLILWNEADEKPRTYQPKGIALGLVDDRVFKVLEESEVQMREGDTLLLYTDGVVEATNAKGEEYGPDRLMAHLRHKRKLSAERQIHETLDDIQRFTGGIPQQDDITIVAIKTNHKEDKKGDSYG